MISVSYSQSNLSIFSWRKHSSTKRNPIMIKKRPWIYLVQNHHNTSSQRWLLPCLLLLHHWKYTALLNNIVQINLDPINDVSNAGTVNYSNLVSVTADKSLRHFFEESLAMRSKLESYYGYGYGFEFHSIADFWHWWVESRLWLT